MTNSDTVSPVQSPPADDAAIRPFQVSVSRAAIDDLRDRLARTRWTADLPGTGWEGGVPTAYLRDLAW